MKRGLKSAFVYALIVSISAVVAVVVAELYLASRAESRASIPFYNRLYPYVMFRPHENIRYVSGETFEMSHHTSQVYHYTNDEGFRVASPDYELSQRKPMGQFRVAVLGGSAVQLGSTFETTLPGSLKAVLQKNYPERDIEVINAGIQSCVSRQSLVHLLFSVVDYEPDVVILYDGANDLGMPLMYDDRPNFPYNFQTMEEAWDQYREEYQEPLWELVLNRSYLYNALLARFDKEADTTAQAQLILQRGPRALAPDEVLSDSDFRREFVDSYLSNWRKLVELSAVYDYDPVCILQPTGGLDREYALAALRKGFPLEENVAQAWVDAFASMYEEAVRQIEGLGAEYPRAVFADLSGALQPAEKHFWDGVHVYDETNTLLAERIHGEIKHLIGRP